MYIYIYIDIRSKIYIYIYLFSHDEYIVYGEYIYGCPLHIYLYMVNLFLADCLRRRRGARGAGGGGSPKRLYKAPTDCTKPQKTIQRHNMLDKNLKTFNNCINKR